MSGPSDDEFAREIEAHVAIETDRLIEDGVDPRRASSIDPLTALRCD